MITVEELKQLNWKENDHNIHKWYSYGIEHTSHSNEYFVNDGNELIYFPYYALHINSNTIQIQDVHGDTVFDGRIRSIEDLKVIMNSVIRHTYQKED